MYGSGSPLKNVENRTKGSRILGSEDGSVNLTPFRHDWLPDIERRQSRYARAAKSFGYYHVVFVPALGHVVPKGCEPKGPNPTQPNNVNTFDGFRPKRPWVVACGEGDHVSFRR